MPAGGLLHAGAINFGKTNLDQFASGLVGTRTPYGVAPNAFDSRFIPGGSSSGSAAAVGAGLLTFALGTDTAGSGRVPAGYNGCVGLKGSLGKISTVGKFQQSYCWGVGVVLCQSYEGLNCICLGANKTWAGRTDCWNEDGVLTVQASSVA
jgi:Asp-tRNA(Asn)/Glu-tRNA(Gln) amidotransferase A subunit family amidase